MASPIELVDLRVDIWGNKFNTAGARLRNTERLLNKLQHLAYPTFEKEIWSPARVYKPFTFVHDSDGNSFVSLQEVPSGIPLYNPNYWVSWESKDAFVQFLKSEINRLSDEKANRTDLTSPFNFKGAITQAELPYSGNEINDTYYLSDLKYRCTWNGTSWYQSSMSEEEYLDELGSISSKLETVINSNIATVEDMKEYLGI